MDSQTEKDLDNVSDSDFDLVLNQEENGVSIHHLMSWVDDLVSVDNETENETNCCKNDCSDCDDKYKMGIVDFEKYIKDNGVIC